MKVFIMVIEFLLGIAVTGLVLLQPPKGEGLGAIGGQAKLFNPAKGLSSGMERLTAGLGAVFLLLALFLSVMK